jgi:hypothetical protein
VKRWLYVPTAAVAHVPIEIGIAFPLYFLSIPQTGDANLFYAIGSAPVSADIVAGTATSGSITSGFGPFGFRPDSTSTLFNGVGHMNSVNLGTLVTTNVDATYGQISTAAKESYSGYNVFYRNDGGATFDGRYGRRDSGGTISYIDGNTNPTHWGTIGSAIVIDPSTGDAYFSSTIDNYFWKNNLVGWLTPTRISTSAAVDFSSTTNKYGCWRSGFAYFAGPNNNIYKLNASTGVVTTITPAGAGYYVNRPAALVSDGTYVYFFVSNPSSPFQTKVYKMDGTDTVIASASVTSTTFGGSAYGAKDAVISPLDGLVYVLLTDGSTSAIKSTTLI